MTSEVRTFSEEQVRIPPGHGLSRLPVIGVGIGGVGLVLAWLFPGKEGQFAFSWLFAYAYFLSIALGALFFVCSLHVTNAGWGITVRRLAENVMATLPLFAALFIPIWLGRHDLYHWTHAEAVAHDPILQAKAPYLNEGFFMVRALLYFVAWSWMAMYFSRKSVEQDLSGDHAISRRLRAVAAPSLIVFSLTVTFAAFDWLMSLEPHWYSTMWGVYYFAGSLIGIFAFLVVLTFVFRSAGFLEDVVTTEHFHDLGKLLFAFTVFWAYIAFSQYFLIWYGNIPEETVWFRERLEGSWRLLSLVLAVGHFGVPFFFLMPRSVKRKPGVLLAGAVWMLIMHLIDIYWIVMPTLHQGAVQPTLNDAAALLAVGGFFAATIAWWSTRRALVPLGDPRLGESLSFENT